MFTGIIEGTGTISGVEPGRDGLRVSIRPGFTLHEPGEGESIAVNGVCLTAAAISERSFTADVSPETLSRTTLKALKRGDTVNLERALRPSDRMGGHIVSGHIDCVGEIVGKRETGAFLLVTVTVDRAYDRYIIEKGSIAIDGMSLTVNGISILGDRSAISLAIIPHTASVTTMGKKKPGDRVNVEVDLLGKYIEKLLHAGKAEKRPEGGVDADLLRRFGYM